MMTKDRYEILEECAGLKPLRPWGADVGAILEGLKGDGYIDQGGRVTLKGSTALEIGLGFVEEFRKANVELVKELDRVRKERDTQTDELGDEEHPVWLVEEAEEFIAGPMPTPPSAAPEGEAVKLEDWRQEITHPNSRLLFRRMLEKAGIVAGQDDIASALAKVAALSTPPRRPGS